MTGKIPVGATIAHAYRFAFGNIVNNLGAIWIPVAILWLLSFLFFQPRMLAFMQTSQGDPQAAMRMLPLFGVAFVVIFVLLTSQIAALTKEALGLRTGNAFLQFPFGGAAWRLMAAYLLYLLAIIAIYIVIFVVMLLGGLAIGLIAHSMPAGAAAAVAGLAAVIGTIAILCGLIYIAVRLSFLLAPVAVAERRITLERGWRLTRGNFWRCVAVSLSVVVPLMIVEIVMIFAVYGVHFFPSPADMASPAAMAQWSQHQHAQAMVVMEWSRHYWFIGYPLALLIAVIMYALLAGISAFAYRALVAEEPAFAG